MHQISPQQLAEWLENPDREKPVLIDVREPWEYELCHLPGSVHVPMGNIPGRLNELDPDAETVVICHHGVRSYQVAAFLERAGFEAVHNLSGGIDAWSNDVDPAVRRY